MVMDKILMAWHIWAISSLVFIWENKLKAVKLALKEWEKFSYIPPMVEKE
jgi:hypothetical protein